MPTWPNKDPQEVADFQNDWSLGGDRIATSTFNFVTQAGLVKNSETFDPDANTATVWLSAGLTGQTAILVNRITTTGGRTFDSDPIYLPILETYVAPTPPPITDYTMPTAADLVARFPSFATVSQDIVTAAIAEGARMVDVTWTAGDYRLAIMLYACHVMTTDGIGATAESQIAANGLGGFQSIRSGQLSFDRGAGSATSSGEGLSATSFGRRFLGLLRRNKAGILAAPAADVACDDYQFYPVRSWPWAW